MTKQKSTTIVLFGGDLDKAIAAFIIANGAAAYGHKVTIFFTFWGLNALKKNHAAAAKKGLLEKIFGWMMPRGADKLRLSKMNFAGMGPKMIKQVMKKHNVMPLPQLMKRNCSLSMFAMNRPIWPVQCLSSGPNKRSKDWIPDKCWRFIRRTE